MQHRAGAGVKQTANFGRDQIGAQDEHGPARIVARDPRHRLVHPHQRVERGLQVLDIGRGALVENHQIDRQLFQPPIFVRAQKLADEFEVVVLLDPHQHDGQIAGNSLRPERRRLARAALEDVGGRPQGRIGIEDMIGEALEQMRFVRADAEMVKLHLRLRPGKRRRPLERHRIVMLVGQIEHLFARRRRPASRTRCAPLLRAESARAGAG